MHLFLACSDSVATTQENYRKDLTMKDAEVMALSTLKEVMEEKVTNCCFICMLCCAHETWKTLAGLLRIFVVNGYKFA